MSKIDIPWYSQAVPYITTEQMVEVDRLMIEEYNIQLIQMMENAGRCLAILAKSRFLNDFPESKVIVLAGTGGNGGGAMVCARRLANWGIEVEVVLSSTSNLTPVPKHQLEILRSMNVPIKEAHQLTQIQKCDLIIDGIIGYSIKGNPRGTAKSMIEWTTKRETPVLSLDTPSGIDLTTGKIHEPIIKASATLTLALPKVGLQIPDVKELVGELYIGDISVPPSLYAEPTINIQAPNIFNESDIVRIN